MKRILTILAAVALGACALSACGEPEPETTPIDIKDLLFSNSEIKRNQAIQSSAMKQEMKYNVYLPPKFDVNTA